MVMVPAAVLTDDPLLLDQARLDPKGARSARVAIRLPELANYLVAIVTRPVLSDVDSVDGEGAF